MTTESLLTARAIPYLSIETIPIPKHRTDPPYIFSPNNKKPRNMSSLQEVLEKSSSLLKREKLQIKPLERVLFESNSLLSKLSGEEEGHGDVLGRLSERSGEDFDDRIKRGLEDGEEEEEEEEEEEVRKVGKGIGAQMLDEGVDEFRLGETLLVEQGFNLGNYVNSLRDLSLSNLRELRAPVGDLPLSQFLFKEESFLLLSSVEECKTVTSRKFEDGVRLELDREWTDFRDGVCEGGGYVLRSGDPLPAPPKEIGKGFVKEEEKMIGLFSSILLDHVGAVDLKGVFSGVLFGYESFGKVEVYRYLESICDDEESLVRYLEENYFGYVKERVRFFYGEGVGGLSSVDLLQKYVRTLKEGDDRWRILFLLVRTNRMGESGSRRFVEKHFERETDVLDYFFGGTSSGSGGVGVGVGISSENYYENLVRNGVMLKRPVVFSKLKIEDYIWVQMKVFGKKKSELRDVLVKNKNESFYSSNHFLFFKLLLFFSSAEESMDYYYKHFPGDSVNFFHFFLILYVKGKLTEKYRSKFLKTFDVYLDQFLDTKDRILYSVFIKNEKKIIQSYLSNIYQQHQLQLNNSDSNNQNLTFIRKCLEKANRAKSVETVIKKIEENLTQNGLHLEAINTSLFILDLHQEEKIRAFHGKKILKTINFYILNNDVNNIEKRDLLFLFRVSAKIQNNFHLNQQQVLREEEEGSLLSSNGILINALKLLHSEKKNHLLIKNLLFIPTQQNAIEEKLFLWKRMDKKIRIWLKKFIIQSKKFTHVYSLFFDKNVLNEFLKKI